jgi:hypothetical protein
MTVTRMTPIVTAAVLALASHGVAHADGKFAKLGVYLEQTVEDEDSEVRFEAIGGDEGLASLQVVAPDGRTVVDFKAPDSKLGIRQVSLETPEPKKSDGRLQKDFPEGTYRFTGSTVSGAKLQGEARLSYGLPEPTSFVRPRPGEKDLPATGLQVRWSPVKNLALWQVVIEHEATGRSFKVNLPASVTAVAVPDGFLAAGTKYTLAVGAVAKDGNTTFVETTFTTAGRK